MVDLAWYDNEPFIAVLIKAGRMLGDLLQACEKELWIEEALK